MNYMIIFNTEDRDFALDVTWFRKRLEERWGGSGIQFSDDVYSHLAWEMNFSNSVGFGWWDRAADCIAFSGSVDRKDWILFALWFCSTLPSDIDCLIAPDTNSFSVFFASRYVY